MWWAGRRMRAQDAQRTREQKLLQQALLLLQTPARQVRGRYTTCCMCLQHCLPLLLKQLKPLPVWMQLVRHARHVPLHPQHLLPTAPRRPKRTFCCKE